MSIISAVSASGNKRHFCANGPLLLPLALKWRLVRFMAFGLLAALVLPCIMGRSVSAASITLTVPDKLLFSVPADGEFHESAAATISVESDSYAGYTFSITGSETTNAALKNGSYSIVSIGSAMESSDFPDNTWGWLPSKLDSNANTKYQPGPTTSPVTIEKTNHGKADMVTNQYAFTLGAKVTTTVVPGAYSNTFTLTVTANDVPYNITYSGEGVSIDALTGEAAEGSTVTLAAAPTREGYEFQGWCDKSTTDATCPNGTVYEAEGDYMLANSANTVTLYAMWKQDTACVLNGERVTEITDPRDGNVYKVRRLADGQCWMIQNLRLGDSKLKNRTLTPDNTDLNNGLESYHLPESSNSFSSDSSSEPQQINNASADTIVGSNGETIGVYYSWYAATAGTGTYRTSNTDATSSICPKGWRLPKGDSGGDFQKLVTAIGTGTSTAGSTALQDPDGPNFVLSGSYGDSSARWQGSNGYYWSSTAHGALNLALRLFLSSSGVFPENSYDKYGGSSVRCIARETMQTVEQWEDSVEEGQTVTAVDERDGNTYTVRRLADGKLWMIQNLRLGDSSLINRTIDSANSDLPSDKTFNVPTSSTSGFSDYRALNVYVDNTYGGYYTWGAATAGTGTGIAYAEQQASGSICPKGWRLPERNEFRELNDLLGTPASGDQDAYWTDPNGPNFVRAGFYRDGLPVRQGTGGYYWTSVSYVDTVPPSTSAYLFYNSSSTIYTIYGGPRKCGVSVRCIAQ